MLKIFLAEEVKMMISMLMRKMIMSLAVEVLMIQNFAKCVSFLEGLVGKSEEGPETSTYNLGKSYSQIEYL